MARFNIKTMRSTLIRYLIVDRLNHLDALKTIMFLKKSLKYFRIYSRDGKQYKPNNNHKLSVNNNNNNNSNRIMDQQTFQILNKVCNKLNL